MRASGAIAAGVMAVLAVIAADCAQARGGGARVGSHGDWHGRAGVLHRHFAPFRRAGHHRFHRRGRFWIGPALAPVYPAVSTPIDTTTPASAPVPLHRVCYTETRTVPSEADGGRRAVSILRCYRAENLGPPPL